MTKALRVPDYLGHILKAIERIDRYMADVDEVVFLNSELVQDAVIRNIEIIGEASNNIQRVSPEFAAHHDDIPWEVMYTMRNRVSHGYDTVDMEIVWKTIHRDLPELYRQVQEVVRSLPGSLPPTLFVQPEFCYIANRDRRKAHAPVQPLTTRQLGSQGQVQGTFLINPRGNSLPARVGLRLRISGVTS